MAFKQTWWDINLPTRMEEFKSWIGTSDEPSKIYLRKYIKELQYKSVIDLGCGTATEYEAYLKDIPDIKYLGIDSSEVLFKSNKKRGVPMLLASAEETTLKDNYTDCVFSRHVLEHQPDFKNILTEMIRIASKEAIHVFFIPPSDKKTHIGYDEKENLYHNRYNEVEIDKFLMDQSKVVAVGWEILPTKEVALHIKLDEHFQK